MKFLFCPIFPAGDRRRSHSPVVRHRELRESGHEVEVVTAPPNYPVGKIQPGYTGKFYHRETRDGRDRAPDVALCNGWQWTAQVDELSLLCVDLSYGLARATKPDFLFVESPPLFLTMPGYTYSRLRSVPFILNIADLWPDTVIDMGLVRKGFATDLLGRLERWSYRKAAYVNAITQGIRSSLLSEKKLGPQKVLYLPNGVNTATYRPQPPDEGLKQKLGLSGKKIILYAGTLGRAHGLENVLKSAQLLEHKPEIHFLFLGDGSERPRLQKLQSEMGLRNVTFHDFVPLSELRAFYSIADCGLASLLNLQMFEGARPSKIFAVLASAKPIVYFGQGEGARLVEQARAGVVVPPEDSIALARTISELLSNPALVKELGENGRRFVAENYKWSKLVAAWIASFSGTRGTATTPVREPEAA